MLVKFSSGYSSDSATSYFQWLESPRFRYLDIWIQEVGENKKENDCSADYLILTAFRLLISILRNESEICTNQ